MKIMVFDVPADKGGALTILKKYYNDALHDASNNWIFVISTPQFDESQNVKILKYPWVKISWMHRLFFDYFYAKRIIKKNSPDEIISLQNVIIPNIDIPQTLYLHQSLQFARKRYTIFENIRFWTIQNVISKIIYKSIKKADKVIVQTNWIKDACVNIVGVAETKVTVEPPTISIDVKNTYKQIGNSTCFFYPADSSTYKNHEIIVKAVDELVNNNICKFSVIFTLKGDESRIIKKYHKFVNEKGLPIVFVGPLDLESVYDYYSQSILLFPSFIETFGLPMLEARAHGSPIIASDCDFSHEVLAGYNDVKFFDPFNYKELYYQMKQSILKNQAIE